MIHQAAPILITAPDVPIARKAKFDRLLKDLAESPMEYPEQHFSLAGAPGMGKTFCLEQLAAGIHGQRYAGHTKLAVVLPEGQYGIMTLQDLWQVLHQYLQAEGFDWERENLKQEPFIEQLLDALAKQELRVLLFIDRLDQLMAKFSDQERRQLREVLMTRPELRIVGSMEGWIGSFAEYHQPFFEFFQMVRLEGLSQREAMAFMISQAQSQVNQPLADWISDQAVRIECFRRYTGGSVRALRTLFRYYIQVRTGGLYEDLQHVMGKLSACYQLQMAHFSRQQQQIINGLGRSEGAIGTGGLAQKAGLSSKVISAQLQLLTRQGVVRLIRTGSKNHVYQLADRSFQLWYGLIQGFPDQKALLRDQMEVMQDWVAFGKRDENLGNLLNLLQQRAWKKVACLLDSSSSRSCYLMAEAMRCLTSSDQALALEQVVPEMKETLKEVLQATRPETIPGAAG